MFLACYLGMNHWRRHWNLKLSSVFSFVPPAKCRMTSEAWITKTEQWGMVPELLSTSSSSSNAGHSQLHTADVGTVHSAVTFNHKAVFFSLFSYTNTKTSHQFCPEVSYTMWIFIPYNMILKYRWTCSLPLQRSLLPYQLTTPPLLMTRKLTYQSKPNMKYETLGYTILLMKALLLNKMRKMTRNQKAMSKMRKSLLCLSPSAVRSLWSRDWVKHFYYGCIAYGHVQMDMC